GNHGEDVKEIYWYIDGTPTHSYLAMCYRYSQAAFPYAELIGANAQRSRNETEFEIENTDALRENRFFDIQIEYAKASSHDILIKVTATNRGPSAAPLHILPTIWFRNTWSWGRDVTRPNLQERTPTQSGIDIIGADHHQLGNYALYCEPAEKLLFTENDSNLERLWGVPNQGPYVKD